MSLETLRAAVIEIIQTAVTDAIPCTPHGGRFDLGELRRVSAKAPAVLWPSSDSTT